jgi:hypothetical protein
MYIINLVERMNKLYKFLQRNTFPILIIIICGILAWRNYIPGTILSGWDTLHPEFDLLEYAKRALGGVWMEHQGLGAVASQAHPAELTRLLVVGILDLLLPLNLVRYSFFFICLTTGAVGAYYFSKYIFSVKWHKNIQVSSFLASLFYIFNLVVVQQFYVPLEMFAVHYALLPWLFLLGMRYIREKNKKVLLLFSVVTLFASSMAHTATLFYIYLGCLGLFLVFQNFKRGILLLFLTVAINSFWILPNLYFVKNHATEVSISKIHSNFTDEAFMQSQSYGDLNNLVLSKNFLFNWREFSFKENKFVDLLDEWKLHLDRPYVREIGYVLFSISIFGLFASVVFKSRQSMALFPPFLLSVFFLINENPPFTGIFIYLRENFPLIKEGLRFPFTKFSIVYILILSIWFGFGSRLIISLLDKIKLGFVYTLVAIAAIFYFQLPQFQGFLISPSMKVKIPDNYFELNKWLDTQDESARIVKLPLNTYWGWVYNDWGYQGAGFTWFGIKQPTLDREFDRWSKYNESFFNEASFALYGGDKESFKRVLEKYQVRYLLLDESIMNAGENRETLKIPEIKNILHDLGFVSSFSSGFLTIYDSGITTKGVSALDSYTSINADLTYSKVDPVYKKYGNYIQSEKGLGLPFVNFDQRGDVKIKITNDKLLITNNKEKSTVEFPITEKITETFAPDHGFKDSYNCDLMKIGSVSRVQLEKGREYLAGGGGVACDYFVFDSLKNNQAYIVHIKGENTKGRSLKVYLYNLESKRMETEELLPGGEFDANYIIYPKAYTPQYILNIETRSFGSVESENSIETLELIPFDMDLVSNLYIDGVSSSTLQNKLTINGIQKYGTWGYKIDVQGYGLIQLSQSYDGGWIGVTKVGPNWAKLEHTKVNSWANGWNIPNGTSTVYIIFWPQMLEWGGMFFGVATLLVLAFKK